MIRQLEAGSVDPESNVSCLGLLTMINDYRVQLGWCFEEHAEDAETLTVTTSAVLSLKNVGEVAA